MDRSARHAILWVALGAAAWSCGDDGDGSGGSAGDGGAGGGSTSSSGTAGAGGADSCATLSCGADEFCYAGACHACDPAAGSLHDQELVMGDGEEDRYYFLHVPATYACAEPAPLLVDFHGTAGGDRPEESYQNDALVALAEAEGAIVVRPRSRSSVEGGFEIFRWDQNPGDLARNIELTKNLVDSLRQRFHIDGARVYASGFSSGANMTSQFFGSSERGLFSGLAPIAGGVWSSVAITGFEDDEAPRLYAATGYRDYLYGSLRDLFDELEGASYPPERMFFRETDTGHELYAWHFPELFAWLDRGERPARGAPTSPWVAESSGTLGSFVAASPGLAGEVFAATSNGEVVTRSASGTWLAADIVGAGAPAWTSICVSGAGDVLVAGEGFFSRRLASGGGFQEPTPFPPLGSPFFGRDYVNGIACAGGSDVVGGGYWSGVRSTDLGATWTDLLVPAGPGYEAQIASVAASPTTGTVVAVGYYNYVGRGAAGASSLDAMAAQPAAGWWNDVTATSAGAFVAVADNGAVMRSLDDGFTWFSVTAPTSDALYTVAFADAATGVAAGRRGIVIYTRDGGSTWQELPTGVDDFFGAIAFVDADTVLVLGEGGRALRATLPAG
jgi:photosystem II stability/assembly factor-like uncharacterized protein/predicted esterase